MAFSARRSLATSLSHHFSGRLYPSISHLVPSHHEHSDPAPSPSPVPQPRPQSSQQPAPPFPSALPRPSRSRALAPFPLPFALHLAAHRYSSAPAPDSEVLSDSAAAAPVSELLSDGVASAAASVSTPPLPYPGEVAAAAAESFPPVAALQHLLDAVQSFTGLNWWATIALTTLMIRLATVPLLINQMKSMMKLNEMRPEIEAINEEMRNSTDPRSMEVGKQKLGELFLRHGVTPLTPLKGLFIQGPIFMSFFFAISNMVEKVPSMKGGGVYWFTDLTTPDNLLILPVLTSLTFLATVELNMQDGMEGNHMLKPMKKFSRFFGVLFVPFTIGFPKAIFFYWVTSNFFSLVYGAVLRNPAVRLFLNLPRLESQPTTAEVQPLNLSGGPEPSPGVDSPITDKETEQSSSVLSPGVDSPIADKECEQSSPAVSPEVNSPMVDKESEQSSSVLCDRIRDLEIRAKATGESRE
ncbi:Mitochondrial inner membrane protein OXA1-like [Zea mays]|uniref:Mitochondrial inner membrane protein OXA1-like n=1 Tax=Zea mays TaxID=4577 RepID=A0A317YBJ0_MAIZE|nr:Mitochondrial inner membrane protein OXA1-like [Zea mays]